MSDPSIFRIWLRRQRQNRGLTQEDLGELVGYTAQTIRKIEGGQRRPSPQLALRLAEALELPAAERAAWMAAARVSAEAPGEAAPTASADAPGETAPATPEGPRPPTPSPGLPAYLTPFVGREQERADLAALLGRPDCRLVTVLGPGGVGKTRLAIETARALQGFPDGVAFVSLAPVAAPQAIVTAIADALGFAFSGAGDLLAQLNAYLRDKHILLILDNLEHLLDPDGATVGLLEGLLALAPDICVLATSRERLRLAGEWVLELGGLALPRPEARARLGAGPALTLFVEHAQRVDRAFSLSPANEDTVTTICRLVDGLPLGIELAAAWARLLSLEEIAQELARGLDTAHLSPRTAPSRHHSLRSVVEHSWQLLGAGEREVLRRLAVFRGGFTREAAAHVAGASLGVLANLADKSLLRRGAGGRHDLHELIRQYADERLREGPGEDEATRGRHASYYLRFVAERDRRLKGAEQAAAAAELSAEIDNIRAAWRWGFAHGLLDELEGAAEVLQWFCEFRSYHQEAAALFAQAADHLRATMASPATWPQKRTLGRLLGHYGYNAARVAAFAQSGAALAESRTLLAGGPDPVGLSRTLAHQGITFYWQGKYGEARQVLDQSLALADTTGDLWTRALCESWLSIVAHGVGAYHEAEQLFRAALAGWRQAGSPRAILWCITYCGMPLLALGKHHEAEELLRESLALSHATDDRYGTAMALHHLGLAALQEHAHEEAIYFFREALPLLKSSGSWEYAQALNDLGGALWLAGARGEARRAYGEALTTALDIQALPDALQAVVGLATHLSRDGEHAAALGLAARVLAERASKDEARRQAAAIREAARAHLPADEAARIEEQACARPLTAMLSELAAAHARPPVL